MVDSVGARTYHNPDRFDQDKLLCPQPSDGAPTQRRPAKLRPTHDNMDNSPSAPHDRPGDAQDATRDASAPDAHASAHDEAAALVAAYRRRRLPSFRASAALAVAMLTLGVGVGAAIGPSPATSLA